MSRGTNIQALLNPRESRSKCTAWSFGRLTLYPPGKKALLAIQISPGRLPNASEYVRYSRLVSHPDSSFVKPVLTLYSLSNSSCTVPVACNIYNVRSAHLQVCRRSQVITTQRISHADPHSSNYLKNYFLRPLNPPHEILISVTFIRVIEFCPVWRCGCHTFFLHIPL